MTPIDRLIAAANETKRRVCVLGCSMEDVWLHGDMQPSQDGVMKFVERLRLSTPGGAAGAARQLARWNVDVGLISLVRPLGAGWEKPTCEAWNQVPMAYALECRRMPVKTRYIDATGRIVFRHDLENGYGLDANGMQEVRELALKAVKGCHWDAVLISDYEKGFVDEALIRGVIEHCRAKNIPVVADAKRKPSVYRGAALKFNEDYAIRFHVIDDLTIGSAVMTLGPSSPSVKGNSEIYYPLSEDYDKPRRSPCVNHVGAGDCFSVHLTLALAHGLSLEESAVIAHSAGRVYVAHEHGRPPWPFETRRDLDPVGGKVVQCSDLPALRRSIPGRIVFSPGCFRLGVHAGHAFTLQWAREQGDALIVGLNSDASVRRIKPGKAVLPSPERAHVLASLGAVDWLVVFDEDDPCAVIEQLKPDLMVKGWDNAGHKVPGYDLVQWKAAPPSPSLRHASDL